MKKKKKKKTEFICKVDIKTNEGNKWRIKAFQIWHKKAIVFIYRIIIFPISFYQSHLVKDF